jgi:benzoate/toluate 1,2-dioxygenase reductase subunit
MFRIDVTYADGATAAFPAKGGQTVLQAADAAEVPLAYSCLTGSCRTCAARGHANVEILLCQQRVSKDEAFWLPYSQAAARIAPVRRRARLLGFKRASVSVHHLRFAVEFPVRFLAGQYAAIAVPSSDPLHRRSFRYFSMANPPEEDSVAEFYVRDLPGGYMAEYLANRARPGDVARISIPHGSFYHRSGDMRAIFVAGGTGLSPLLAMLRSGAMMKADAPAHVVFGVQRIEDLFALDALRILQNRLTYCQIVVTIGSGPLPSVNDGLEWCGGTVMDGLRQLRVEQPEWVSSSAYICGPPGMVDAARAWLTNQNIPPTQIYNEAFTASGLV